jgi:translation initiation factor 2 beta subunit (eIF-2beta)/eIF-5
MDFDFETMCDEAYQQLEMNTQCSTLILPNMILEPETTKLTWKNVKEYLRTIRRHPDHFMEFLKKECPSKQFNWVSGSKSDGLIIHGKFQKRKEITELALKYIDVYVVCPSCKKVDTKLTKLDSKNNEFECLNCGMKKNL